MDSLKFFLVFAVVFVFIVGCVSPPQNNPPNNPPALPPTPPNNQSSDQPPSPPDAPIDLPPAPPNDPTTDLAGKSYEALVLLGIPLECNIESTYQGQTTTMKVYMKGSQEIRNEIVVSGSQCTKMVGILKQGNYYLGCLEGTLFPGCDWLSMSQQSTNDAASAYSAPDYSDVPSSKISCLPWVYDASKFTTTGKVCSLDDIFNNIPNVPT